MLKKLILVIALIATCLVNVRAEDNLLLLPIALNLIPGLGLGSFIQGNILGGFFQLAAEITGTALLILSVETSLEYNKLSLPLLVTGFCVLAGAKILGLLLPFWAEED